MGIQGLIPFLKKSSRPITLSEFKGKTAAVDTYCWLHKGAFSCAEKLVRGEKTDGYVLYVMKQVNLLLSFNIKPILVFDGCRLPAKELTESKRRESRDKNRQKAKELLREGKIKEARECFQRCVDVTSAMAHEVIKACRARNIDTIVAPYEADSQLAFFSHTGVADVVITEDSDLVLFGCDKILFKIDNNGGGILVEKEKLHLSMNISREKFDFNKFRNMCILSGCDYLPSLYGIGLAKACRFFLVTSNPDVFNALCKVPLNLKMPHLDVTLEYRHGFMRAIDTLLHQLVFDPFTRTMRPLTLYPEGVSAEDLPYCGAFMGHERALDVALGNVDVQSGHLIDNYDPQTSKCPAPKSSGWQAKDTVSTYPSIWSPNFMALKSASQTIKEEKRGQEIAMKGKTQVVSLPVLKRKRPEVEEESSSISEDYLQSLYSIRKKNKSGDNVSETDEPSRLSSETKTKEDLSELDETANNVFDSEETRQRLNSEGHSSEGDLEIDTSTEEKRDCSDVLLKINSETTDTKPEAEDNKPVVKAVSRNPFAKLATPIKSEKISKFSALKKFSGSPKSSTIVLSKYFKPKGLHLKTNGENVMTGDTSIPSTQVDTKDTTNGSKFKIEVISPVKTPLKPKNDFPPKLESPAPRTPLHRNGHTSSFNWSGTRLSQMFSYEKTTTPSRSHEGIQAKVNKASPQSDPIPDLTFETPPSSQKEAGMESTAFKSDLESKDESTATPLPTRPDSDTDTSPASSFISPLTANNIPYKKPSPQPRTPKCRVSGLRKSSSSLPKQKPKQKQLKLKDMFSFKRQTGKLTLK